MIKYHIFEQPIIMFIMVINVNEKIIDQLVAHIYLFTIIYYGYDY